MKPHHLLVAIATTHTTSTQKRPVTPYLSSILTIVLIVRATASTALDQGVSSASHDPFLYGGHHADQPVATGAQRCQKVKSFLCNMDGYKTAQPFKNSLGHESEDDAIADMHKYYFLFTDERCRDAIQLFLCSIYTPVCVQIPLPLDELKPCRDDCERAKSACSSSLADAGMSWLDEWRCDKFRYRSEEPLCVTKRDHNPQNSSSITTANTATQDIWGSQTQDSGLTDLDRHKPYESSRHNAPSASLEARGYPNASLNEHKCDEPAIFKCIMPPNSPGPKFYCIEPRFVCDGKVDCGTGSYWDHTNAPDEADCNKKCGGLYCEGLGCVDRSQVCNGVQDCSSGDDEYNCPSFVVVGNITLIEITIFVVVVLMIIAIYFICYMIYKCVHSGESKAEVPPIHKPKDEEKSHVIISNLQMLGHSFNHEVGVIPEDEDDIQTNHYNELTYASPSEPYERVCDGGYSGASSIYTAYSQPSTCSRTPRPPCPNPPPPTPAPSLHASDSMPKLYENMHMPHVDLLS